MIKRTKFELRTRNWKFYSPIRPTVEDQVKQLFSQSKYFDSISDFEQEKTYD